jgi:homoserine O-succinyltransferase
MPIKIPENLPAYDILRREGVSVMSPAQAARQDIRPLQIGLLNLMPQKIQTETQFSRLIGATPLQIELVLIRMTAHRSRNTSPQHMASFYQPFQDVKSRKLDGLIITGAPIEHLPFNQVDYWAEMQEVMDWTQTNVHSTFGVCWGGMAMINHFHGVQKHMLSQKAFGCFRHQNMAPSSPFLNGFSDDFVIPVSRWTEMRQTQIDTTEGLVTLIGSTETGPCLVEDPARRALYIFNHFEYESDTLKNEYERDIVRDAAAKLPVNYYENDDPASAPKNRWRSHAHLLYGNWINQIYQTTPYDMTKIGNS